MPNRVTLGFGLALLSLCSLGRGANAQSGKPSSATAQRPAIRVHSNVVLVPALVKTKSGEVVFSLTADEFVLTDNGVRQPLKLEQDTDSEPLALTVIVETGGDGASHLSDYADLGPVLDAVVGGVPHRVAVVAFDSAPRLALDFTTDTDSAAQAIASLQAGDSGGAILDALNFGIDILRKQSPEYRRAVLLISETADSGSHTSLENVLREVDDTNAEIYAVGFSSTRAAVAHEAAKLPRPGGSSYEDTPYGPGGCMGKGADPGAHGNRGVQAFDCASDLLPPLRLVRMAFLAARDGLRRNVPQTVAHLTGGEYFAFKDSNALTRDLLTVSNDVPNYYVLSFSPRSPAPGFHALTLSVKGWPDLNVKARDAYVARIGECANNRDGTGLLINLAVGKQNFTDAGIAISIRQRELQRNRGSPRQQVDRASNPVGDLKVFVSTDWEIRRARDC
ncbi:MAG: VWA domain-containing protein [Candidatus Acidiferrales bacterium]